MKKVFCLMMAVIILTCFCIIPVSAAETSEEVESEPKDLIDFMLKSEYFGEETKGIFDSMSESQTQQIIEFDKFLNNAETLNKDDFYEAMNSADANLYNKLSWEVPTSVNNVSLLNIEYSSMVVEFSSLGYGENFEIEIPEFNAGYSGNIQDRFNETYGNINFEISSSGIPEGWTMQNIMAEATALRDTEVAKFKDNEAYKTVVNFISIGSIFEEASQELTMFGDGQMTPQEKYNKTVAMYGAANADYAAAEEEKILSMAANSEAFDIKKDPYLYEDFYATCTRINNASEKQDIWGLRESALSDITASVQVGGMHSSGSGRIHGGGGKSYNIAQ